MIIKIDITDKRAGVIGAPIIVCGNSSYSIEFIFDADWSDYSVKTARFIYAQGGRAKHQDVVFTGTTVEVPVLSNVREVLVGVYAGDLQTTTPARIPCEKSILCGDPVHDEPAEDVYNQLLALLNAGGGSGGGAADGFSPVANVTQTDDGAVITVIDKTGTTVAAVYHGKDGDKGDKGDKGDTGATGANGQNGADGKTPVKGTDYFTEADKAEMVNAVISALPTWTGGAY